MSKECQQIVNRMSVECLENVRKRDYFCPRATLIQAKRKKWGGRGGLGAPLLWPSLVTLVVVLVVAVFVRASSSERSKSFTDARCKVPARLRDIVLTFLLTFY